MPFDSVDFSPSRFTSIYKFRNFYNYLKCERWCTNTQKEHVMYECGKYSCYISDSMLQPSTTIYLTCFFVVAHFDISLDFFVFCFQNSNNKPVMWYVVKMVLPPFSYRCVVFFWGVFCFSWIRTKCAWARFTMNRNLFQKNTGRNQ